MEAPRSSVCYHPDIHDFGHIRCCLSCGFTLPVLLPISALGTGVPDPYTKVKTGRECHYTPLNYELGQEIRLLIIKPGNFYDCVECQIIHVSLLDKPKYEALSYTWANEDGDDALSSQVLCSSSRCTIEVTANCNAALRRLRRRNTTRTIWVDSICIDQGNIKERNHQVKHMGAIYASAEQVLVYLGEHSSASRAVFKYLTKAITIQLGESVDIVFPPEDYVPSPETMREFLSRRWFHRLWVLQEVGLAKKTTLLCGEQSLDWSIFSVDRLNYGGLSSEAVGGIIPGVLLLETDLYKKTPDIVNLLHAGRNALCKDPRDKVYALLSLKSKNDGIEINPDYSKPVSWLFQNVAIQSILMGRSLEILSHVRGRSGFSDLPSWAPDWTLQTTEKPLANQFDTSELELMAAWDFSVSYFKTEREHWKLPGKSRILSASLSAWKTSPSVLAVPNHPFDRQFVRKRRSENEVPLQMYNYEESANLLPNPFPTRIVVRAHRLAMISSIFEERYQRFMANIYTPEDSARPVFDFSRNLCSKQIEFWGKVIHGKQMQYFTPEIRGIIPIDPRIPPSFGSQALCLSCGPYKNKCDVSSAGVYHQVEDYYGSLRSDFNYHTKELDAFLEQKELFGSGRVLFRTEHSLGLGPSKVRRGDSIWLLHSSKVALILRNVDSHYVVIGECHLHGALRQYHPCPRCKNGIELASPITTEKIEIW